MDVVHAQLAQIRTRLDDVPALQKLEVSYNQHDANIIRRGGSPLSGISKKSSHVVLHYFFFYQQN
jgi:hypothetical protein